MNNSFAISPDPRLTKSLPRNGEPKSDEGAGAGSGEKEPPSAYGPRIAQTALQSIGMRIRNCGGPFTGQPEYAAAVSFIFTKATEQAIILGTEPKHALSTSILRNSLLLDRRLKPVRMSEVAPGDIVIESAGHQAGGYAGIVVDHGRIVGDSGQGVRNNSSLLEIQRNRQEMAVFRYIGVQGHRAYPLANAGFNYNEPRLPAGQTGGGRWTNGGAQNAQLEMAPSTTVLSGGNRWTPGETTTDVPGGDAADYLGDICELTAEEAENLQKVMSGKTLRPATKVAPSQQMQEWTNPITAKPAQMQTIDPASVKAGEQTALGESRIATQKSLIETGTPRKEGPPKVNEEGVVVAGHHHLRAAADMGRSVEVNVVHAPEFKSITNKPVTKLPTYQH